MRVLFLPALLLAATMMAHFLTPASPSVTSPAVLLPPTSQLLPPASSSFPTAPAVLFDLPMPVSVPTEAPIETSAEATDTHVAPLRVVPPIPPTSAPYVPTGAIEQIICSYDWTPFTCGQIVKVAACESGRDREGNLDGAWDIGFGANYGVFQINRIHAGGSFPDMFAMSADGSTPNWADVGWNVAAAYTIFSGQGLRPWSCAYAAYR